MASRSFPSHAFPERSQALMPAHALRDLLGASPSGTSAVRLFEAGSDGGREFVRGHIVGAAYLDTNWFETPPFWNKIDDNALLRLLLDNGIRCDSTVVLYARNTLAAARIAHLLLYAGVRDVRLLDGGYDAWLRAGQPVAIGLPNRYPAAAELGSPFPARPEFLIGMDEAQALLQRSDAALASIRTLDEFTGKTSGYDYIDAAGDIPGARWGRAGDNGDVNSMSAYQHADGTMRDADDIAAFWREAGIHPHQHVAFYCGTGWRASLAFFYARVMGWDNISVYDGGWFEWSVRSGLAGAGRTCRIGLY
jgi:thiosulfate/3-mercaptopyruvate sulfurtransferase